MRSYAETERRRGRTAFTLVELLLAMTITAMALGSIYAVFRGGMESWRRGTDESRVDYDGMFLVDLVGRDLRGAVFVRPIPPGEAPGGAVERGPVFTGDARSMEFTTAAARSVGVDWPAHRLKYSFEKESNAERGAVTVERMPAAGAVALADEAAVETLVDRAYAFKLRYLKEDKWLEEWTEEEAIPAAVEVTFELGSEDGRVRRTFAAVVDVPAWQAGT